MKRTKEQSISFFKTRNTQSRGDGRELYLTPKPVIKQIISDIIEAFPELRDVVWIDPCAADGRWGEVAKTFGINCLSFDIHPLSDAVEYNDFLNSNNLIKYKDAFFIGNPPFSMVKDFVNEALSISGRCYFLGGSMKLTGKLSSKVELLHCFSNYEGNQKDRRSKILFTDTNGNDVIVWCCGALFTSKEHNSFERSDVLTEQSFAVGPKSYCIINDNMHFLRRTF